MVLGNSAMVPVMDGVLLWKSDWQLTRNSVNSPPVVHSWVLWKCALLRRLLIPLVSAAELGYR